MTMHVSYIQWIQTQDGCWSMTTVSFQTINHLKTISKPCMRRPLSGQSKLARPGNIHGSLSASKCSQAQQALPFYLDTLHRVNQQQNTKQTQPRWANPHYLLNTCMSKTWHYYVSTRHGDTIQPRSQTPIPVFQCSKPSLPHYLSLLSFIIVTMCC